MVKAVWFWGDILGIHILIGELNQYTDTILWETDKGLMILVKQKGEGQHIGSRWNYKSYLAIQQCDVAEASKVYNPKPVDWKHSQESIQQVEERHKG